MGNMTLDKLAEMVAQGFEEVDTRFDEMGEDVKLIKERLDSIEMELIDIKKKLENVVYRHEYEILKDRVTALEKRLKSAG